MADVKLKPFYKPFKDILVPGMFKDECLDEVADYKPTPEDVFIVTYPKCGTTWMQIVALYIFRKGVELENYGDFGKMCPFVDPRGMSSIVEMPRPGALKTHLPYHLMPKSPKAKYIFVLRNPKDACVSMFYHAKSGKIFGFEEGRFNDFFELFMEGKVEYGDYFDHLQAWYPHRNDNNLFHTTYEDMKADLKVVVLRLAEFLGKEYIEAIQSDNNVLNNILRYSGFDHMKKMMAYEFDHNRNTSPSRKGDGQPPPPDSDVRGSRASKDSGHPEPPDSDVSKAKDKGLMRTSHFRKGIVGDWRSHFSEEQSERMNQKFFERFGGTEIFEKYKPFL